MKKAELTENIDKIKELILDAEPDYNKIDAGIELARALDEPAVFEALLGGWSINDEGILVLEEGYKGETLTKRWSDESWPYFAYALVNLIGYAPKNTKVDDSLQHSKVKTLDFNHSPWFELPSGLTNLTNLTRLNLLYCKSLQNVDALTNLTNLTSLDLSFCYSLQNVDGLANLTNLTSLDLEWCSSLQNVDGLANLTNLDCLYLSSCKSLQNVDGLANLTNLTILCLDALILSPTTRQQGISLQNVDVLANLTNLTRLNLSCCSSLQNVDGLANLTNLTDLSMSWCKSLKNVDGLANLTNLTRLHLGWCKSLKNVDGLANLINLTSLFLGWCDSLQNVDGLANLTNLPREEDPYLRSSLDLRKCDKVHPKPSIEKMTTREEVAAYQEEIKKSMK